MEDNHDPAEGSVGWTQQELILLKNPKSLDLAHTGGRLENIEKECGEKWTYCCARRGLVHAREIRVILEGETGYMGESVIIVEWCNTEDKSYTG